LIILFLSIGKLKEQQEEKEKKLKAGRQTSWNDLDLIKNRCTQFSKSIGARVSFTQSMSKHNIPIPRHKGTNVIN